MMQMSLRQLCDGLVKQNFSAEDVITEALAAIDAKSGQGDVAFLEVAREEALEQARHWDRKRRNGESCPDLAGVPVSIKDCIDIKGCVTRAGSRALDDGLPAESDAGIVAALKQKGAIIIGRTNMTEFAYSGLGNNAHFGTPLSDLSDGRLAGGSSSGAAVSVAEGMAAFAIGTDTSGSVRIPAAFCGVSGFRPSQGRYPIDGVIPLASSFDVVGLLARTADDLCYLDEVFIPESSNSSISDLDETRFLVPKEAMEDLDGVVVDAFNAFIVSLEKRGASVERLSLPALLELRSCVADAGIVAAEALAWHKELFAESRELYDPRVAMRLGDAHKIGASEYLRGVARIRQLRDDIDLLLAPFQGVLLPTTPIVAPKVSDISHDDQYLKANALVIRNTSIANHLDLPSMTIPINRKSKLNVGAMLIGRRSHDRQTLDLFALIESILIGEEE